MKKFGILLAVFLCLGWILPVTATASTPSGLLAQQALAGNGDYEGTAKAVVLYEMNTDTLVYAYQPDLRISPTGIVKVLTALIALEEGNLDDVVTVRRSTLDSVSPGAVSAGLKAGEEISLRDLLYCIMVSSANDACAVVAEHIAGSQQAFVEKMNARAATLGCANTHFTNVHGLSDANQYSTARDLALITVEALGNLRFTQLFGVTEYTVPATNKSAARTLHTTNFMMNPDSPYFDARVTGGKPAAVTTQDRSLVCVAEQEGSRYLCVVMSAQAKVSGGAVTSYTNFKEGSKLLNLGFEGFAVQQVLGAGQNFGLYPVEGGENHVVVTPEADVFALLPVKFDSSKLQLEPQMDSAALTAPVQAGQAVGTLQVRYNGVPIGSVRLLAGHDVALAGSVIQTADRNPGKSGISPVAIIGILALAALAGVALWRRSAGKKRETDGTRRQRK